MLTSLNTLIETLTFIYLSYLLGDVAFGFSKFNLKTAIQNGVYRILTGYGTFGLISFSLGSFGHFGARPLWLLCAVVIFLSHKTIGEHLSFLSSNTIPELYRKTCALFKGNAFLKTIMVIWIAVNLLIVFVPVTGHDTLDYHLPIMQDLAKTASITFNQDIGGYPYLPVLGEIIYATPIVLFNETSAPFIFQVLQYSLFILIILLIYDFAKRRTTIPFLPFVAAFGAMAVMDFEREVMHGGYVDILSFVFSIASLFLMIEYVAEEKIAPKVLAFSAFLVAIGASIKYPALFIFGANGLILLYSLFRQKTNWKRAVGFLLLFTAIFTVIVSPWYIKNYAVFGNPVYPMFTNKETTSQVGLFVRERTLPNLVVFPFYKFSQWFFHDKESSSQLILLGYFILMYLLIIWLLFKRTKWTRAECILFLFIEGYFSFIFFVSHQNRFMLPALILIPTLLAPFVDRIYTERKAKNSPTTFSKTLRRSYIALSIAIAIVFLGNLHYFYVRWKYFFGIDTRQAYIIEIGGM